MHTPSLEADPKGKNRKKKKKKITLRREDINMR
jgi:hypothetical protein